jgi:hypothetical protein
LSIGNAPLSAANLPRDGKVDAGMESQTGDVDAAWARQPNLAPIIDALDCFLEKEGTMHQPNTECQIGIVVDGEEVCGTVRYGGSNELYARLDSPSIAWTESVHMPNFARGIHPEGFLGEYGESRALSLLVGLYKTQKKGDRRYQFAGVDYPEFGRVRYLRGTQDFPAATPPSTTKHRSTP